MTPDAPNLTPDAFSEVPPYRYIGELQNENVHTYPVSVALFPHQVQAVNFALGQKECALLMEQGTGKTLAAITTMGIRYTEGQIKKVLIVAPLSVIPSWRKELRKYASFPYELSNLTKLKEDERTAELKHLDRCNDALRIALINYESTWRFYPGLYTWAPDMIICDESQKIKKYNSKQSKCMHMLGDIAPYKLILTGTPVTQSPLDFWSQYRFLKPTVFGYKFWPFKMKYAVLGGWMGKQVVGYRDLDDLAAKAHGIAYRVTKAECLKLPPSIDQDLYLELSQDAKPLYKKMKKDFGIMLESGNTVTAPMVITQLIRLQQITGGFVKNDQGVIEQVDDTKLKQVDDLLTDLPCDKKVVVFCRFIPEAKAVVKLVLDRGERPLLLYGKTPDRGFVIDSFQSNPKYRVLVVQIQTGGLGITLTAASTAIFYSTTFSYADYEQAKARLHRIGQNEPVTNIHLLTSGTVDEDIIEAIRQKRDVAEYVVDKFRRSPPK